MVVFITGYIFSNMHTFRSHIHYESSIILYSISIRNSSVEGFGLDGMSTYLPLMLPLYPPLFSISSNYCKLPVGIFSLGESVISTLGGLFGRTMRRFIGPEIVHGQIDLGYERNNLVEQNNRFS